MKTSLKPIFVLISCLMNCVGLAAANPRHLIDASSSAVLELPSAGECSAPFLSCRDGVCLPPNWICDGEEDCVGGEDEDQILCSGGLNETLTSATEYASQEVVVRNPRSHHLHHDNQSETSAIQEDGLGTIYSATERNSVRKPAKEMEDFLSELDKQAIQLILDTNRAVQESSWETDETKAEEPVAVAKSDGIGEKNILKRQAPVKDSLVTFIELQTMESITSNISSIKNDSETFVERQEELSSTTSTVITLEPQMTTERPQKSVKQREAPPVPHEIEDLLNKTKHLLKLSEVLSRNDSTSNCTIKSILQSKTENLISKLTCPYHFQFILGRCIYVQVYPPVTWHQASAICDSQNGQLLIIHSPKFFAKLLLQLNFDKQRIYSFWIGATNNNNNKGEEYHQWSWDDSTPVNNLAIWGFSIQKSIGYFTNKPDMCAFLDGNMLSYVNAASCLEDKGFICQLNPYAKDTFSN